MKIFLIGLRRSGTTAFFELFRQDRRLVCFDEPFNPMIRDIPDRDEWGTKREFIDVYDKAPVVFWAKYAELDGLDELRPGLDARHQAWLSYLIAAAPDTFMDFTRVHFKLAGLHAMAPDAVLVHVHRSPAAFAASHLLPSIWKQGRAFKYWRQKNRLWRTMKKYNHWGLETVIGRSPRSLCGEMMRAAGIDADAVYGANAATRLAAFWLLALRRAQVDGQALFGGNYLQIPFEAFTRAPDAYIAEIYKRAGLPAGEIDVSGIRPASGNPFPGHAGWKEVAEIIGIDPERETFEGDLVL